MAKKRLIKISKLPRTIEEAIEQQRILSNEILNNNLKPVLLDKYKILGEEISLIIADYKCENCSVQKELTYHHLISRVNKQVIPLQKYLAQRRNYRNMSVLCRKCHALVDGEFVNKNKFLSEQYINQVKKRYEDTNNQQ